MSQNHLWTESKVQIRAILSGRSFRIGPINTIDSIGTFNRHDPYQSSTNQSASIFTCKPVSMTIDLTFTLLFPFPIVNWNQLVYVSILELQVLKKSKKSKTWPVSILYGLKRNSFVEYGGFLISRLRRLVSELKNSKDLNEVSKPRFLQQKHSLCLIELAS